MYRKFVDTGKSVEIITYSIQNNVSKDDPEIVIPYAEKLAKCPFCGGDAEIRPFSAFGSVHGLKVRCKKCYCGTGVKNDGTNVKGVTYTLQECLSMAISSWNERVI